MSTPVRGLHGAPARDATAPTRRAIERRVARAIGARDVRSRAIEVDDANDLFGGDVARAANLIVIGGRGCGKSSVCRRLAASDKRFKLFSLDDLIVYEAGMAIPDIVARHGWRYFRDLEYEVCVKAGRAFDGWTLIDAGGGVVTDLDENDEEMYSERKVAALKQNNGLIVFLDRDVEYLVQRIEGDVNRPDLSASKGFREIMARRLPWYRRAADLVVDGGGFPGDPDEDFQAKKVIKKKRLASRIAAWYYNQTGQSPLEDHWFQLDLPTVTTENK